MKRNKNQDQTHKRAASKGRRGTLAVLEYERGAILSLRLSKVGRSSGNSQSCNRLGGCQNWRRECICGGPCVSCSLALTIAGESVHRRLLSHPLPDPDSDLLPHKKSPIFAAARSITDFDISIPADNPANRQDGSPRRSPCWYEIRLLSEFPGEGYDQALDLPQAVQVRRRVSLGRGCDEWMLIGRRVGDIVDIKVNGAVQKG